MMPPHKLLSSDRQLNFTDAGSQLKLNSEHLCGHGWTIMSSLSKTQLWKITDKTSDTYTAQW